MLNCLKRRRKNLRYRITSAFIIFTFISGIVIPPSNSYAQIAPQTILNLPVPGTLLPMSSDFTPMMVKGLTIHPDNPLKFDFIIHKGDSTFSDLEVRQEASKLVKYFLATLTVPEDELWVNLSPYENDRIISESFGQTEMGRDLLTQDYLLKQLTASLMYPEDELGKKFWDGVYKKAYEQYGTTEIPMNTFNKVWILPEKAVVYEHEGTVFVIEQHLKVMLEEDYLALQKNLDDSSYGTDQLSREDVEVISGVTSEVVREILLPELEKEVNTGKTFANLRQIYNSMILATWYKQNLKNSLLGQVYIDQSKIKGVDVDDPNIKEKIYNQYVTALKKGVYNYIKEDFDAAIQQVIPRKYFSGGMKIKINIQTLKSLDGKTYEQVAKALEGLDENMINAVFEMVGLGPGADRVHATAVSSGDNLVNVKDLLLMKAPQANLLQEIVDNELWGPAHDGKGNEIQAQLITLADTKKLGEWQGQFEGLINLLWEITIEGYIGEGLRGRVEDSLVEAFISERVFQVNLSQRKREKILTKLKELGFDDLPQGHSSDTTIHVINVSAFGHEFFGRLGIREEENIALDIIKAALEKGEHDSIQEILNDEALQEVYRTRLQEEGYEDWKLSLEETFRSALMNMKNAFGPDGRRKENLLAGRSREDGPNRRDMFAQADAEQSRLEMSEVLQRIDTIKKIVDIDPVPQDSERFLKTLDHPAIPVLDEMGDVFMAYVVVLALKNNIHTKKKDEAFRQTDIYKKLTQSPTKEAFSQEDAKALWDESFKFVREEDVDTIVGLLSRDTRDEDLRRIVHLVLANFFMITVRRDKDKIFKPLDYIDTDTTRKNIWRSVEENRSLSEDAAKTSDKQLRAYKVKRPEFDELMEALRDFGYEGDFGIDVISHILNDKIEIEESQRTFDTFGKLAQEISENVSVSASDILMTAFAKRAERHWLGLTHPELPFKNRVLEKVLTITNFGLIGESTLATPLSQDIQDEVEALGMEIINKAKWKYGTRIRRAVTPAEWMMKSTAIDEATRARVAQFVSLLPTIARAHNANSQVTENFIEFFTPDNLLKRFKTPAQFVKSLKESYAREIPGLNYILDVTVAKATVILMQKFMAKRFFVGEDSKKAVKVVRGIERKGFEATVDVLGDKSFSEADSERYRGTYEEIMENGIKRVSLKISNLFERFAPEAWDISKDAVKAQLNKLIDKAIASKATEIAFDMEYATYKDLTIEIFMELVEERWKDLKDFRLTIAIQTYFKNGVPRQDIEKIVNLSKRLNQGRPEEERKRIGIRHIKGANYSHDMMKAKQSGWGLPHHRYKAQTDITWEENAEYLLDNIEYIHPQFATHNVRSMAWVRYLAKERNISNNRIEFQVLRGMIPDEIAYTLRDMGYKVTYYAPFGNTLEGLGYLMRRLLESSDKESALNNFTYKNAAASLRDPRERFNKDLSREEAEEERKPGAEAEFSPEIALQKDILSKNIERIEAQDERPIFEYYQSALEALKEIASTLRSPPGVINKTVFRPRGSGVIIIDQDMSENEIIEAIAAPLMTGNKIIVLMRDQDKARAVEMSLDNTGLIHEDESTGQANLRVFTDISETIFELEIQRLARERNSDWIVYLGNEEREKELREIVFTDMKNQRSVKEFVTQIDPYYLNHFVVPISIKHNVELNGFVPDLFNKGGFPGFKNVANLEFYKKKVQNRVKEEFRRWAEWHSSKRQYLLTIGNKKRRSKDADHKYTSRSPIDKSYRLGTVHYGTKEDANDAVNAAEAALGPWSGLPAKERVDVLREFARELTKVRYRLFTLLTLENGKGPIDASAGIDELIDFANYYAAYAEDLEKKDEALRKDPRWKNWRRKPAGVTASIGPFNFPAAIQFGTALASIVMGNTVVIKPSEQTSVIGFELMKILQEKTALKNMPGVVNYVQGKGDEVGAALVENEKVKHIVFTGSFKTATKIKEAIEASGQDKTMIMETGGKNAGITTQTADPQSSVEHLFKSVFNVSGQRCSSCSVAIPLKVIAETYEEKLLEKFASLKFGDPRKDPTVNIIPVSDQTTLDKINEYHLIAQKEIEQGILELVARKDPPVELTKKGFYPAAAIYKVVEGKKSRLASEEIFGPILVMRVAKDIDEALEFANEVEYGLTFALYGQKLSDIEKVEQLALAGNIYFNDTQIGARVGEQPFGGIKHSGIGYKAGGPGYLEQFTRLVKEGEDLGGINLNPNLLDLQIKRDGNGVPLPLPLQPIQTMNIQGFIPVLINITPITLPNLIGLSDQEENTDEISYDYNSSLGPLESKNRFGLTVNN